MKLTQSDISLIHRLIEAGISNTGILSHFTTEDSLEAVKFHLDILEEIGRRKQELRTIAPFFLEELKVIKEKLDSSEGINKVLLEFRKTEVEKKIIHWTYLANFL